ncbi:killer toxin [Xylaria digitata]|nr:killer toxin [Xylaria digitata]
MRIPQVTISVMSLLLTAMGCQCLGINCRGSGLCDGFINTSINGYEADTLTKWINGIDPNRWYNNGQQIACFESSHICAFLQNTGGAWGSKIKQLAHYIPDHNCKVCGSVPYYFPEGNNNVADGMLTYNYVTNACGHGLCA